MLVRQKKLTLHTPYNKINQVLWQSKRLNSQQLSENTQLKTQVQQLERRRANGNEDQLNKKIAKKYEKLTQTYKSQAATIDSITSQIEERNYEQLKGSVKKIENKLNATAQKALRLQRKVKGVLKREQRADSHNYDILYEDTAIDTLQSEKKNLEQNLERKERELVEVQAKNKQLNRELLNLLTVKNRLRDEAKEMAKGSLKPGMGHSESKDKLARVER